MSYVIETSGLSKWYGNVLGLNDVTLGVESGVTGLLGPNGAGKSTLLKLITGQLKPNIGEVRIYGQKIWNNYSLYSRIGFCPEQDSFYEELSGWDFLVNLIKLHNGDEEEEKEKANSALNVVELLPVKDRVVRSYSRGMRQRLKFAQAIAHDPDVLILDEPLNGLDPLGRRRIIRLIKELGAAGKTILVSSHILPEIEAMTKKIILIHQGKVFAQGNIHYIRDLIETHPHVVSLRCSRVRDLAAELIKEDFVLKIDLESSPDNLRIETNNRDKFFELLLSLINQMELEVEEIVSSDDNLQAVFDYLIGK